MFKFHAQAKAASRMLRQRKIENSGNYRHNRFHNLVPTDIYKKNTNFLSLIYLFLKKYRDLKPQSPIQRIREDLTTHGHYSPEITWFGHSSYLISINGRHILVDPVFSKSLPFFFPFRIKEFPGTAISSIEDLPDIDMVIITHDHQDHLDLKTIKKLGERGASFYVPLAVGYYLERVNIPAERIIELGWWESITPNLLVRLTATPARHFSGRGLTVNKTLWASFVLEIFGYRIFIGGDSGYGEHFRDIGQQFGRFDLVILECGQYGDQWCDIHMSPEQTLQAAIDLNGKILMPVHWGRFTLGLHVWHEPVQRLEKALCAFPLRILCPMIGKRTVIFGPLSFDKWWKQMDQSRHSL